MSDIDSDALLRAAQTYAALGWPVLPLHTPDDDGVCDCPKRETCESPGKHPRLMNGLKGASTNAETIGRWWRMWPRANVAIDLAGAGLVDIAPDSAEWWAEFTARGLPDTHYFASGAGDGHLHYLYLRSEACPIHRDTRSGEYDLMSNGYAVAPPSLHASGRVYAWLNPAGSPEADLPSGQPPCAVPEWAVRQLSQRAHRGTTTTADRDTEDGPPVVLDGDGREYWYGRMFEAKPDGSVDRSRSLWRLAVILLEAGLRARYVEQLLAERDEALGWSKFTDRGDADERYAVIVERAQAGVGPGRVRVGSESHAQDAPSGLDWLTGASIVDTEDEDVTWIAPGFVGVGLISEIDGKAKVSGKTTLALALARTILTSAAFLGSATTYTPIVYLSEQSAPSLKRNLRRAGLLGRSDLHILLASKAGRLKWPEIVAAAIERAKAVGAKLIVVDTLGQFSGIRGDQENSAGSALSVMVPLQVAQAEHLGVLVLRHDRKSGGEVGDSGRGSSAFTGAVDIVLHLERLPRSSGADHDRRRLLSGVSRMEETPASMLIELSEQEPFTYSAIGDVSQVREHLLRMELLRELPTTAAEAMALLQIREVVAADRNAVLRVLGQLVHVHDVVRLGTGKRGDPYRYYRVDEDEDEADD